MKTLMRSVLWSLLLTLAISCTTAPKQQGQRRAAFDSVPDATGNYQNSGVLGFTNRVESSPLTGLPATNRVVIITATARDRYNALIKRFGGRLNPPLLSDAGLYPLPGSTNLWTLDKYHLEAWATMNTYAMQPVALKPP